MLMAGTILAIGTIWDAVNDPIIGFIAVNHKFKNGERCRPFALWYSIPWAVTVVLLFTDFGVSIKAAAVFALVIYIVFEIFNTLVGIPYNSMGGGWTAWFLRRTIWSPNSPLPGLPSWWRSC
jgi:Na+/melibiose symporter-like transporter